MAKNPNVANCFKRRSITNICAPGGDKQSHISKTAVDRCISLEYTYVLNAYFGLHLSKEAGYRLDDGDSIPSRNTTTSNRPWCSPSPVFNGNQELLFPV